jgi:cyclopropane-fatty-acyl-phospholipid synthase
MACPAISAATGTLPANTKDEVVMHDLRRQDTARPSQLSPSHLQPVPQTPEEPAKDVQLSLSVLKELFRGYGPRDFAVRLWDGSRLEAEAGQSTRFTLVLQHPAALRELLRSPSELTLGEAYIYNDLDLEGDLESAVRLGFYLVQQERSLADRARLAALALRLPSRRDADKHDRAAHLHGELHSKQRDRAAIRYHYDVSNDFYALFLGKQMVYSEAYFESADDDLDTAHERQLERICRKLHLQPGERLLDVGCGWGGLIIYAARRFGVQALGITLSERQAEMAAARIQREGMAGRCRVEVRDYRDLNQPESFDKIASIGMFEHVGRQRLGSYFRRAWRLLRPGGTFLNSGIARPVQEPARRPGSFVQTYVFPDGELVPIHETLQEAESAGFEVTAVESLREHYGTTLRHWVRRLEEHASQARREAGEISYRIWRLYMAGSAARFFAGNLNTYQTVLRKSPAAGPTALIGS